MDSIRNFLKDISDGVFKNGLCKINETMKLDERFQKTYDWLYKVYVIDGQGFKSIIKDYNLSVSYSFLRRLIYYLNFQIHSNIIANDFLKNRRSKIAKINYKTKTGFFKEGIQEKIHHTSECRGIQGYYWNASKRKYVWLRSSWEFIYAKWLNSQKNVIWDVEIMQYKLEDNTSYRPDFFIYGEDENIDTIVEVKGYWKDKVYKVDMLRKQYDVNVVLVDDIKPYCENTIKNEISLWKKIRKLELKE